MTTVQRIRRFARAVRHLPAHAAATREVVERLAAATALPSGAGAPLGEPAVRPDERHLDDLARSSIRYARSTVPGTTVATTTDDDVGPALARARAVAVTGDAPTSVLVLAPGCLDRDERFERLDDTSEVLRLPEPVGRRRAALLLAASARTSHVIVLDQDVEPTPGAAQLLLDGTTTGADLVRGHVSAADEDGSRRLAPKACFVAVSVAAVHACLAVHHWSTLVDRPLDEALAAAGRSVLTIPRLVGGLRPRARFRGL